MKMMNKSNSNELLNQINIIRKKMIETGLDKGINNTETIDISKQLDRLLLNYQLLSLGKNCG
jgi:hypothetical protein